MHCCVGWSLPSTVLPLRTNCSTSIQYHLPVQQIFPVIVGGRRELVMMSTSGSCINRVRTLHAKMGFIANSSRLSTSSGRKSLGICLSPSFVVITIIVVSSMWSTNSNEDKNVDWCIHGTRRCNMFSTIRLKFGGIAFLVEYKFRAVTQKAFIRVPAVTFRRQIVLVERTYPLVISIKGR